jgi:hypothetical protein
MTFEMPADSDASSDECFEDEDESAGAPDSEPAQPPMQFSLLALMLGITLLGFLLGLGRISPAVTALIVFVGSLLGGVIAGTIWIATHFGQASQGTARWFGSLGRLLPLLLFSLVAGWLLAVFGSALRSP